MTYREYNEAFLKIDNYLANHCRKNDENCPFIENLIYRPNIILRCHRPENFDDQTFRSWDDEISTMDREYLFKVAKKLSAQILK